MPRILTSLLIALLATGCGCSGVLDREGNLDPDALDAADQVEATVDADGPEVPADAPDALVDPDAEGDPPGDPAEEEAGCTSDGECSDSEPCNGEETCGGDGACHAGTPLDDGTPCTSPAGVEGICLDGACRPPGCGDGVVSGTEECDDENSVPDDGCENDCTFSCHSSTECADSDVCTDDACVSGGTGRICTNTYNTAPCDDSSPCTHTDRCNGAGVCTGTGYACTLGVCESSSECDGSGGCTVTYSSPGSGCSDSNPCTHTDVCDGSGGCAGTGYTCTPGTCETASACDGSGGCIPTYAGTSTVCNDSNPCTHTDRCNGSGTCIGTSYSCTPGTCEATSTCNGSGGCTVTYSSPGSGCSDSNPCTHTDVCDGSGGCAGTGYTCTPGTCQSASTCDGSGGCVPTYSPPGTACTDRYSCTTGDTCDGAGNCRSGAEDDTACAPGEVCRPACFPSTGCGLPPGLLDVTCPDRRVLTSSATCSVDLDGLAGQIPCISCTTETGMVTLSHDGFEGTACNAGGWTLVTGPQCLDKVADGGPCTPGGATKTCCADAATIAYDLAGDCVLRTDRDTNCGGSGDSKEWRITHAYDTTGLTDVRVCFRIADELATDNEGILLYALDPTHSDQVFCLPGPPVVGDVDLVEWPYCAALPSWAEDNADLELMFVAHSNDDGDVLFLDDVVVTAWTSSCTPTTSTAFTEGFSPCPVTDPVPSGWNGWTITGSGIGSGPTCTDVCAGGTGGFLAEDDVWSMSHRVDTSALDGDVTLCFSVGDDGAGVGESITVEFDAGAGWREAWYWQREWGADGSCEKVCLGLSDLDHRAARNPDMAIRFTLGSDGAGQQVLIDDVVVEGAVYCSGAGLASLGAVTDLGGGSYSFTLSDVAGVPLGAWAVCSWDTPPDPVLGWDGTWFHPSP